MSTSKIFLKKLTRLLIRLLDKLMECWCGCFGCQKKTELFKVSYYRLHIIAVRSTARKILCKLANQFGIFRKTLLKENITDSLVQLDQDFQTVMPNLLHSKFLIELFNSLFHMPGNSCTESEISFTLSFIDIRQRSNSVAKNKICYGNIASI